MITESKLIVLTGKGKSLVAGATPEISCGEDVSLKPLEDTAGRFAQIGGVEQAAGPNGGPAKPLDNWGVTKEPPSVVNR